MKPFILLFVSLSLTFLLPAQVSKTVDITAGGLSSVLTAEELSTINNLTLTGTINAVDIETIQNQMPSLTALDLSQTTITATTIPGTANFPANWFPGPSIGKNSLNYGGLNKPLLTSLQLPSSLEVIGSSGLSGCSGLTSITIPSTVIKIGWSAFESCTGLTSITIPPSVTYIDEWAFSNCTGLKEFTIPSSMTSISRGLFSGCSGFAALIIPSSVSSIGQSAYTNCTGLTSIVLPASVENIGAFAFLDCTSLASIYSYRNVPPQVSNTFGQRIKSTCILYVPFGSKALYEAADEWKDFTHIVEMGNLKLSETAINLKASQGSTASVVLTCDMDWTADCDKSWLTISPDSGTGCDTLDIIAQANTTASDRTATVTLTAQGVDPKTILITQKTMLVGINETAQQVYRFTCYPNPFTDELAIEIMNPKHTKISVDIYNMAGQRIKNLAHDNISEQLNLNWNGTNDKGQEVPMGVYICKMNEQSNQLIFHQP